MTNEEKAEEICRDYNYTQFINDGTHDIFTETAVLYMLNEMAQWKDRFMKTFFEYEKLDVRGKWWITHESGNYGLSIINTKGAYCDSKTYEIAIYVGREPNRELFYISNWGDSVKGFVTIDEVQDHLEKMCKLSSNDWIAYIEAFKYKNK